MPYVPYLDPQPTAPGEPGPVIRHAPLLDHEPSGWISAEGLSAPETDAKYSQIWPSHLRHSYEEFLNARSAA